MTLNQLLQEALHQFRKHQRIYEMMVARHTEPTERTLMAKSNLWLAANKVKLVRQKIAAHE